MIHLHHDHHRNALSEHAPATCTRASGTFSLRMGRAMTLQPTQASVLRISKGVAWVTLPSVPGDHFLRAGDQLRVPAGDHVVMEAWQVPCAQMLHDVGESSPQELGKLRWRHLPCPHRELAVAHPAQTTDVAVDRNVVGRIGKGDSGYLAVH